MCLLTQPLKIWLHKKAITHHQYWCQRFTDRWTLGPYILGWKDPLSGRLVLEDERNPWTDGSPVLLSGWTTPWTDGPPLSSEDEFLMKRLYTSMQQICTAHFFMSDLLVENNVYYIKWYMILKCSTVSLCEHSIHLSVQGIISWTFYYWMLTKL